MTFIKKSKNVSNFIYLCYWQRDQKLSTSYPALQTLYKANNSLWFSSLQSTEIWKVCQWNQNLLFAPSIAQPCNWCSGAGLKPLLKGICSLHATSIGGFSSVAQSCLTLCDPMNRSTPGLPVHHQLPEFTQTHVYWVGDAIQPSHSLSSPSPPALNPSQHQSLFQWVNSSHEVAKVLEFQL